MNAATHDSRTLMCTFRMAGRLFGVDIIDIKEVSENIDITRIHHAPSTIKGFLNIRGQILLVMDLREIFSFEPVDRPPPRSKIVLFKSGVDEPFGILVDSIGDVVEIDKSRIVDRRRHESDDTAQSNANLRKASKDLVLGVYPLEKELLLALNARSILGSGSQTNIIHP